MAPGRNAGTPGVQPDSSPKLNAFWTRLHNAETLTYDQLQPSGYAGYTVECLEAALWCVLNAATYEDAMVYAVNLVGEADTIAAVAGGVAGAHFGIRAIPQRWLNKLNQMGRVDDTALHLLGLRKHLEAQARN